MTQLSSVTISIPELAQKWPTKPRNRWPIQSGMGGRLNPGIGGRFAPEYAEETQKYLDDIDKAEPGVLWRGNLAEDPEQMVLTIRKAEHAKMAFEDYVVEVARREARCAVKYWLGSSSADECFDEVEVECAM